MAHIPYGYRIENGKAAIEPTESSRVRELFRLYLSGRSIKAAKEEAGIPFCVKTANAMLKRTVYLGDGYYPRIISQKTFDAAAVEREKRYAYLGNHKCAPPQPAISPRTRFIITVPEAHPTDFTSIVGQEERDMHLSNSAGQEERDMHLCNSAAQEDRAMHLGNSADQEEPEEYLNNSAPPTNPAKHFKNSISPAERAAILYSMITPSASGGTSITPEDRALMRKEMRRRTICQ